MMARNINYRGLDIQSSPSRLADAEVGNFSVNGHVTIYLGFGVKIVR